MVRIIGSEETMYNIDSDLSAALGYNDAGVDASQITEIHAEIAGANDECNWYWIVKLNDGRYALITGCCDYTGWD